MCVLFDFYDNKPLSPPLITHPPLLQCVNPPYALTSWLKLSLAYVPNLTVCIVLTFTLHRLLSIVNCLTRYIYNSTSFQVIYSVDSN